MYEGQMYHVRRIYEGTKVKKVAEIVLKQNRT